MRQSYQHNLLSLLILLLLVLLLLSLGVVGVDVGLGSRTARAVHTALSSSDISFHNLPMRRPISVTV